MRDVTIKMILEYDTKGAVRYQEIDANGNPLSTRDEATVMGTAYLRKLGWGKAAQNGKEYPKEIEVIIRPKP